MYTGIVQTALPVVRIDEKPGLRTFTFQFSSILLAGLELGASVALDGVCCTVAKIDGEMISFDAMAETLQKTTLGQAREQDRVNIERSAKMGDEIGGHMMSGHIIGMAEVVGVNTPENNRVITFRVPREWMKYFFEKGFIGLHGCSLTLVNVDKQAGMFEVHLIPETLQVTNLGDLQAGDKVNIELDSRTQTIVDTVETYMKNHS